MDKLVIRFGRGTAAEKIHRFRSRTPSVEIFPISKQFRFENDLYVCCSQALISSSQAISLTDSFSGVM